VAIGDVMVGSTVSQVEISYHPDFAVGELVLSQSGWQEYALSDGKGLFRLGAQVEHPSYALGVLGMPDLPHTWAYWRSGSQSPEILSSLQPLLARLVGCRPDRKA